MKIEMSTTYKLEWERPEPDTQTQIRAKVQGEYAEITFGGNDSITGLLDRNELLGLRALVNRALKLVK